MALSYQLLRKPLQYIPFLGIQLGGRLSKRTSFWRNSPYGTRAKINNRIEKLHLPLNWWMTGNFLKMNWLSKLLSYLLAIKAAIFSSPVGCRGGCNRIPIWWTNIPIRIRPGTSTTGFQVVDWLSLSTAICFFIFLTKSKSDRQTWV